jgi:GNAT superfamily N-acetyltransferase
MKIRVRRANESDAQTLTRTAFRSKAFWGYDEEFMKACGPELTVTRATMNNPGNQYYLAENNELAVGFYSLETLSLQRVELGALFVEPDFVGFGIGRILFEHAKDTASDGGFTEVEIQSDPHAAGFYAAVGAELIGERESESIPGRMLPLFELKLEGRNVFVGS